jgi:hypothetical protein
MVFNAITNAVSEVAVAGVEGIVNILQSAAATDVGTIFVVVGILYVGKKVYDKMSQEKKK